MPGTEAAQAEARCHRSPGAHRAPHLAFSALTQALGLESTVLREELSVPSSSCKGQSHRLGHCWLDTAHLGAGGQGQEVTSARSPRGGGRRVTRRWTHCPGFPRCRLSGDPSPLWGGHWVSEHCDGTSNTWCHRSPQARRGGPTAAGNTVTVAV